MGHIGIVLSFYILFFIGIVFFVKNIGLFFYYFIKKDVNELKKVVLFPGYCYYSVFWILFSWCISFFFSVKTDYLFFFIMIDISLLVIIEQMLLHYLNNQSK